MRVRRAAIGLLLLLSATAQAADLEVTRIENGVSVRHADGSSAALGSRDPLAVGDTLSTEAQAHVSLRLAGSGSLLLGERGRLQLDGSEPPDPPGRATLARLTLLSGALHVDARKSEQGAPADVRLTLGALRARLYGAEAWAEHSLAGDELCLVSGAAEIDTPGPHQRLDSPGECLRWTTAGAQRLSAAEAGTLLPRLAATNFSDDYATRYAAQQALKDGNVRPTLADSVVAAPAGEREAPPNAIGEAAPAPQPAAPAEWRIVLGSFADRASAARSVAQWQKRKLSADIAPARHQGRNDFEVRCGHYANREQAEQALARLRTHPGYEHARVTSLQSPVAPPTAARAESGTAATPAAMVPVWRISLGSFVEHANAERSVAQWRARDLRTDIEPIRLKGFDAYRVLCGHYDSREQAEAALTRLRARPGYESARVLKVPDGLSKR
ncbi:SPOR domain-containing protein [Solimonas terrae]|nr:SPOR domain-containing protein [Solimonas terrae]